jgi:sugar/nucleoside kinase (ribokinase family)
MGADVVGKPIDALPEKGKLGLVDKIELHTGGCAANTGVALAILGIDTAIVGKVGTDGFGDFILQRYQKYGIDTTGIVRDPEIATSSTIVFVHSDGERSFRHYFGTNATFCLNDIDLEPIKQSKILHVAGAFLMPALDGEPTANLMREAQTAGVITSLDTVWDARGLWLPQIAPTLPYTHYFLPNYEEAQMLAGGREKPDEIARFLLDLGVKVVGIKLGAKGCYFRTQTGDHFAIPAHKVTLLDALGAGDSFVAGFLAGLTKNWDMEQCARFACAVGACCVQSLGATTGIRTFEETMRFMEGQAS